jgi:hypothetical protein
MTEYTHWLKASGIPGSQWTKVSKEEWIRAERSAGFRPKLWSGDPAYMTTYATGGFSTSLGISGTLTMDGEPPRS